MTDIIQGKRCILRWVNDCDIPFLIEMHRDLQVRENWTTRHDIPTRNTFIDRFYKDLTNYYHIFFIISSINNPDIPIGFFYTSQYNPSDGFAFTTLAVSPDHYMDGCAPEAGVLACKFLFEHYPIRKLYSNVYDFNHASLAMVRRCGFVEEGYMKEHSFCHGKYCGLYTFALYRDHFFETYNQLFGGKEI